MAAPQGFEPRRSAPEADVLPLHYGAIPEGIIAYFDLPKNR